MAQRRADALGALAAGADRLVCGCDRAECESASARGLRSGVVVHVVADQSALDGSSENPAVVEGNGLIPAEVLRELAKSAKLQPLTVPAYFAPEPGYQPSRKLADFVRARDLTCRAPGCDRSTTRWDIDHTVPYSRRSHPRVKPEVPLPFSSLAENILGLVRQAATRWDRDLDGPVGTHLRDHAG